MLRELSTIILPLILPTVLYLGWLWIAQRLQGGEATSWAAMPWVWLAGAGALLLAVVLYVVTVHFGTSGDGVYVPPRYENGKLIQSHIEPKQTQ